MLRIDNLKLPVGAKEDKLRAACAHALRVSEEALVSVHLLRRSIDAREGVKLYLPPLRLCGDNGAMIGAQGYYEYLAGARADLSLNAYATRDIDDAVVAYRAQVRDIFA